MKFLLTFFLALSITSFSYAADAADKEEITLTTYYPAPYGVYEQLYSDTVILEPQNSEPTIRDKGMVFFGKIDQTDPAEGLFVWDGETWLGLIESEPEEDIYYGGYTQATDFDYGATYPAGTGRKNMRGVWELINPQDRVLYYSDYGFKLNFKNLPSGVYVFDYTVELDMDQYRGSKRSINKQALVAYVRVVQYADSGVVFDESERVVDETFDYDPDDPTAPDGSSNSWVDSTNFTTHVISRTFTRNYNKGPTTKNLYRNYGLQVYRSQNNNYMNVRVRNARFTVKFLAQ